MLETGGDSNSSKRLGQLRNRPTNRRNSRDRLDRVNSLTDNGGSSMGGGGAEARTSSGVGAYPVGPGDVVHTGFSSVEAAQVMTERWAATIHALNNPSVDVSDRPVVYSSSDGGSVWGSSKLPFQASVSDFVHEMGQAVLRANSARVPNANHTGYPKAETAAAGHNN